MSPRVWIIGAGFSRPLGGPLLPDLLSENMRHELKARFYQYPKLVDGTADVVYIATRQELGHTDAEGFLEFLDAAAVPDSPQARRLANVWPPVAGKGAELARRARRIVAAECSAFLEANPVVTRSGDQHRVRERWLPFVSWAEQLGEADTVVSFNYDCALEKLQRELQGANAEGADFSPLQIRIVDGWNALNRPGGARVLKLHGSVDWLPSEKFGFTVNRQLPWLGDDSLAPAIALPGPSKIDVTTTAFEWLWGTAREAIKAASEVFIIGYRFPETDAFARNFVLEALRESKVQRVQVVLGLNSPDAPRVRSLIKMTTPTKVVVRPLWSQDFLDRWRAS